jgi:hypothetical protein
MKRERGTTSVSSSETENWMVQKGIESRILFYCNLKDDGTDLQQFNILKKFPIQVFGPNGKTYIIDVIPDENNIYSLHILEKSSQYNYKSCF